MDKRTDIDRPADTLTTRDRAGLSATYGDPRAIGDAPFTDDTAPSREAASYGDSGSDIRTYGTEHTTDETASSSSGGRQRTPDEIERDIERTRAEMSETIDEIEERLSPRYIKREIKDSLYETVDSARERLHPSQLKHAGKRAGRNMFEAIKENPLPAILTGLGLAWWMRSASEQGGNDFRTEYATRYPRGSRMNRYDYMDENMYYRSREPRRYGEPSYYEETIYSQEPGHESHSMASQAREKARHMQHQVSEKAHDVADRASDMAHRMGDRASEFAHELQHRADRPIEAIRENPLPAILPIPALLIGAGVVWWMKSSSEREREFRTGYYPAGRYDYIDEDVYYRSGEPAYYEGTSGPRSTAEEARSKASQLKSQAGEKAHEVQLRAEEMAHDAQQQMYRTRRRMQYRARRATNWMDEMMHENPIAAGALMLGVGALVGLALPGTRREDELMGSTRDHLMDEAIDMAHGYAERAEHVAEHATQEVKQSVREVAKDVVKDVAKSAMTAAKEETREHLKGGGTSERSTTSGTSTGMTGSTTGTSGSTTGMSGTSGGTGGSSGTRPGTTGASTGQIGGTTSGSAGSQGSTPGTGTQNDRNKSGSDL